MARTKKQAAAIRRRQNYRSYRLNDFLDRFAPGPISEDRFRFLLGEASRYYRDRYAKKYKRGSKADSQTEREIFLSRVESRLRAKLDKEEGGEPKIYNEGPYWLVSEPIGSGDKGISDEDYQDYLNEQTEKAKEIRKENPKSRRGRVKGLNVIGLIYLLSRGESGFTDEKLRDVTIVDPYTGNGGRFSPKNLDGIDIALRAIVKQLPQEISEGTSDVLFRAYTPALTKNRLAWSDFVIEFYRDAL